MAVNRFVLYTIQNAQRQGKKVKFFYKEKGDGERSYRVVEPYEVRREKYVREHPRPTEMYLYGYDVTGGKHKESIKRWIISRIQTMEIVDEEFEPRWDVKLAQKKGHIEASQTTTHQKLPKKPKKTRKPAKKRITKKPTKRTKRK